MKISVIGGDRRFASTAEYLSAYGNDAQYENDISSLGASDVVVLPLPYTKDKITLNTPLADEKLPLADVFSAINEKAVIFCGKSDNYIEKSLSNKIFDYSAREDFAILNAYLTAEGAIGLILNTLEKSLRETKTAILGYGRIGRALAKLIRSFGTNLTVYARRSEIFAMLETDAYAYSDIEKLYGLERFDLIINTVPKVILDRAKLKQMKDDVIILELASEPGGVGIKDCEYSGKRIIVARGLPGKCNPVSAGKIIADIISNELYAINMKGKT